MSRIRQILSGVVLASALLVIPTAAQAHGGCGVSFGCYPSYCSPCYTSCYSPCYRPCVYPICYTPVVQTYAVQQPVQTYAVQQAVVRPHVSTPYFGSYGGCKVFVHKK